MLENSTKVEENSVKNALQRQKSLQRHFTEVRERIDAEFDQLSKTLDKRREVLVRQFEALQRQQLSLLHSSSPVLNGEQCCVAVEFTGQQGIREFLSTFGQIRAGRGSNIYDIEPCKLEEFRDREFYFDKEIGLMTEENSADTSERVNEGSSCSNSNTHMVCDSNSNINYNTCNSVKEQLDIKENTCCHMNSESKTNTKSKTDSNCDSISRDKTKTNSNSDCNEEQGDKIMGQACVMNNDTDSDRNSDSKCTNIKIGTNTNKDITDGSHVDALSNPNCNKENTNTHKEREHNDNAEFDSDEDGAPSINDEKLDTSDDNDTASSNRDEIATNNYKGEETLCDNVDATVNEIKEENVAFEGREHPEQVKQWLEQILLETDLEPSVNEVERINLRRVLIN